MASFNLNDYETVEERIRRFYADHPEGRIVTENQTKKSDREKGVWVVFAEIRLPNDGDGMLRDWYVKATGLAFEIDGVGMANKTSALENAETSAIGRALANAGYSGNKRASREEMAKVARAEASKRDWVAEADALALVYNVEGLRLLYADAVAAKVDKETLAKIKDYGTNAAKP
jgi:hypothetical protein